MLAMDIHICTCFYLYMHVYMYMQLHTTIILEPDPPYPTFDGTMSCSTHSRKNLGNEATVPDSDKVQYNMFVFIFGDKRVYLQ